jgi:metal-dependent amidase/aminoacylase/carboxypeptidase family protein
MGIDRLDIDRAVDALRPELVGIAERLHDCPELAFEEHRAVAWLGEVIEREGLGVERGLGGLPTAFRTAVGEGGPTVAILAEYDALPEIGHACGHNLIAAGALGAFLALARVVRANPAAWSGTVVLIGTPAEEGGGGKIKLLEAGAFEGVDAAMMYHPYDRDMLAHPALATTKLELTFHGAPAHAAIAPWDGQSALGACLDGGQAVNIIPERAACVFQVRATSSSELERVRAIVERCARAAALAADVRVEIVERMGYKSMQNNLTLARRFGAALAELGRPAPEVDPSAGAGSTDMGDISHAVPSIHPYLAICERGETLCHQHAFAACARSSRGYDTALVAAKAMARTTADLLEDPGLLAAVNAEFEHAR